MQHQIVNDRFALQIRKIHNFSEDISSVDC